MAELDAFMDQKHDMIEHQMSDDAELEFGTGLDMFEDGNGEEAFKTEQYKDGHDRKEVSETDDTGNEAFKTEQHEGARDYKEASAVDDRGDEVMKTEQQDNDNTHDRKEASEANDYADTVMGLGMGLGSGWGMNMQAIDEDEVVPTMEQEVRHAQSPKTPKAFSGIDGPKEVDDFEDAFGAATPGAEQDDQGLAEHDGSEDFPGEDDLEVGLAQFDGGNDDIGTGKSKKKEQEQDDGLKEVAKQDDDLSDDEEDRFSVDSTEYDFIHPELELKDDGSGRINLPSENFQGTWEGAIRDTGVAFGQVVGATGTYYQAVKNSNIRKAGWSLLRAGAGTANRGALNLAGLAVDVTGADRTLLPGGAQKWLKTKDEMDAAHERAKKAELERQKRLLKEEMLRNGEIMEPPRVRPKMKSRKSTDSTLKSQKSAASPLQYPADISDDALTDVSVDRLRAYNMERGIIQRLETPATVRRQLLQPLQGPSTPGTPSRPPPVKQEESPYPPSDDDTE